MSDHLAQFACDQHRLTNLSPYWRRDIQFVYEVIQALLPHLTVVRLNCLRKRIAVAQQSHQRLIGLPQGIQYAGAIRLTRCKGRHLAQQFPAQASPPCAVQAQ